MAQQITKADIERIVRRLNELHNRALKEPPIHDEYIVCYRNGGCKVVGGNGNGHSLTHTGCDTKRSIYDQVTCAVRTLELIQYSNK